MTQTAHDVTIAGLAVVDVIGRTMDLRRMPAAGSLSYLESVTMTTGGNVCNCGIDLARLGFRVAAITRVGTDGLGEFVRARLAEAGCEVTVALESRDGACVYAEQTLTVAGDCLWHSLAFDLAPSTSDACGRFAINLKQPGTVWVDYALLQPGGWGRCHPPSLNRRHPLPARWPPARGGRKSPPSPGGRRPRHPRRSVAWWLEACLSSKARVPHRAGAGLNCCG